MSEEGKVVPVIPTVSLLELWDRVRESLNPYIVRLKARATVSTEPWKEEVTTYFSIYHRAVSSIAILFFEQQKHGVFDLGGVCNTFEKNSFLDGSIDWMELRAEVTAPTYRFVNTAAGILSEQTKSLRKKFCLRHGIDYRQVGKGSTKLFLRILTLSTAKAADRKRIDEYQLYTKSTLDNLNKTYGHIFIGVLLKETDKRLLSPAGYIGGGIWEREV